MRIWNFPPVFKDEGEIFASWGQARLLRFLDGKYELRGGTKDDWIAAKEWISMFCHDVVVGETQTR